MEPSKAKHMSAKKDFTHVYEHQTPIFYYKEFLVNLTMIEREEILAKYVERTLLPAFKAWAKEMEKPLSVMDFLGCFGNSTLAITNCFHKEDYEAMWSEENKCYETPKPRQFDCVTWGCDISENACKYAKKAGIYDEVDVLDLNKMSPVETVALQHRCRNANILHINSLGYISEAVLLDVIDWFSEGTEPGVLIIGFAHPYNGLERMRKWKQYALKKLRFFDCIPSASRYLYDSEVESFGPTYGIWEKSYYENWFLMRQVEGCEDLL